MFNTRFSVSFLSRSLMTMTGALLLTGTYACGQPSETGEGDAVLENVEQAATPSRSFRFMHAWTRGNWRSLFRDEQPGYEATKSIDGALATEWRSTSKSGPTNTTGLTLAAKTQYLQTVYSVELRAAKDSSGAVVGFPKEYDVVMRARGVETFRKRDTVQPDAEGTLRIDTGYAKADTIELTPVVYASVGSGYEVRLAEWTYVAATR
jgi:hypothetical protein